MRQPDSEDAERAAQAFHAEQNERRKGQDARYRRDVDPILERIHVDLLLRRLEFVGPEPDEAADHEDGGRREQNKRADIHGGSGSLMEEFGRGMPGTGQGATGQL